MATAKLDRDAARPGEGVRDEVIPLVEETASVEKRAVVTGRVLVETRTDRFEERVEAELSSGAVEVERVPVNREVDAVPDIRNEGDAIVVPVVEERIVIQRRLFLTEELHVRRRTRTDTVEVPVTLRRQRAEVVRIPADDPEAPEATSPSEE